MLQLDDPLTAYEIAEDAIKLGDTTVKTRVAAVLALARGGATSLALHRLNEYQLEGLTEHEDALALQGRLLKDQAARLPKAQRAAALRESANAYQKAWQITGGHYSGINAATLFLLSGLEATGRQIAQKILDDLERPAAAASPEDTYYRSATRAEAYLLLSQTEQAKSALAEAQQADQSNLIAHASTLKQFERILDHNGAASQWLDDFRPPATCFYTGRIRGLSANSPPTKALAQTIETFLEKQPIVSAYGALAAGGDILFAEAAIAQGASLNVLLPCQQAMFEARSVAPFGEAWVERYRACLSKANTIAEATNDDTLMGETAVRLSAQLSMGQAIERADALATRAVHVSIQPSDSGHAEHLSEIWSKSGRGFQQITLEVPQTGDDKDIAPSSALERSDQKLAAMLFADLTGFGQLSDKNVQIVLEHVLTPLSISLRDPDLDMIHLDSWGDAIFAVFGDTATAAKAALALQAKMRSIDLASLELPSTLALRIGAHFGPVTFSDDPITGRPNVFGSQVSYASRIEPIAVPGAIVASEAFVSAMALNPERNATSHYIGRQALKGIPTPVRLFSIN